MGQMLRDSLADAIKTSFEVFSELAVEMEDQFDNAADWAQSSDANRSRIAAAVALSGVREPNVPTSLRKKMQLIEFWWKTERTRPDRLENAVNCLEVCIVHLSRLPGDDAVRLAADLKNAVDAVKDTYFPPMFSTAGRSRRRR